MAVLAIALLFATGALTDLASQAGLFKTATMTPTPRATVRPLVISSIGGQGSGVSASQPGPTAALAPAAPAASSPGAAGAAAGSGATPVGALPPSTPVLSARPSVVATGVATPPATPTRALAPAPTVSSSQPSSGIQNDLNAINATATALSREAAAGSGSQGSVGAGDTPIPTAAPPFVPTPSSPG